jgi:hypothetical protein
MLIHQDTTRDHGSPTMSELGGPHEVALGFGMSEVAFQRPKGQS